MRYIDEFRSEQLAQVLSQKINLLANPERRYQFMEFCGGHTHTIHRYGIPDLLPANVELIHGPGCPVCVLPITRIDQVIALAKLPQTILCSYGDMLRVPGSSQVSLLKAKADGADVRMVYSVDDALNIARQNPKHNVIFFAIGFETTTPPTAIAIVQAFAEQLTNFSVLCNHVLTPVAMTALLAIPKTEQPIDLDGLIGPAHVSIIIGSQAYADISRQYKKPIVISGFEPLDVLQSILMLIQQINTGKHEIENQYTRAVNAQGNLLSQSVMQEVFELRSSFEWRGLGKIPHSALQIKQKYADFDAEKRFALPTQVTAKEHKGCECAAVLRGIKKPTQCKLFVKVCTPENPLGSCMVSAEGACAAVYAYGIKERIR
ncbi:MAG TPA: hydrogenase formation protein HypD [Gammaproteobacteria bacterium]|nr:hydrogenase formation protein HypD [Gammaproteobacteria bacterium]